MQIRGSDWCGLYSNLSDLTDVCETANHRTPKVAHPDWSPRSVPHLQRPSKIRLPVQEIPLRESRQGSMDGKNIVSAKTHTHTKKKKQLAKLTFVK